jgi:hypothetical protein
LRDVVREKKEEGWRRGRYRQAVVVVVVVMYRHKLKREHRQSYINTSCFPSTFYL